MRGVDAIMTNEEAKAEILAMGSDLQLLRILHHPSRQVVLSRREGALGETSWVVLVSGDITADQLEAIATWMRDPEGVANA